MESDYKEVFWPGINQIEADLYESCWFGPVQSTSNYPSFEFTITNENVKAGEVVSKLTIRLSPDEQVWHFMSKHPLWRKDPRPLLLVQVFDLLWKLKLAPMEFGKPFTNNIVMVEKHGGTILVEILAEVFIDLGGVHVMHLANYANTHVFDQLNEIYKDNPSALPSEEYAEFVKARTKKDVVSSRIYDSKIQARNRKLRRRSRPNLEPVGIYIDESGDVGFRSLAEPYILCAYVLPVLAVKGVEKDLRGLLAKHWTKSPTELHLNKVPHSKLSHVLNALARILESQPGTCVCLVGQKSHFLAHLSRSEAVANRLEEKPIKTVWPYKLADSPTGLARATLILMLEELQIHLSTETVDFESPMEIYHDQKHRSWMNDALGTAFKRSENEISAYLLEQYGKEFSLKRSFSLTDSKVQPCLWIADWISWEMAQWCNGGTWSNEFERCFPKITFIAFDTLGRKVSIDRPQGTIIKEFPDTAREISSI
jgi:Protein of unknown function (DUF3800)